MPIYESNGKKYNIPDDKVNDFIKSRNDAKLIDSTPYHLSRATSTSRQSNIQKQSDTQVEENTTQQANNGITGGFTTFQDGTSGFIPAMKMPDVKIEQPKIGFPKSQITKGTPFESKNMQETVQETMRNMPVSPEAYFGMSVDRYKQENDWIKEVQNDPSISPEVKQALIDDYNTNVRTNNTTIEDKNILPIAKEWLEKNKKDVKKRRWIPSNHKYGESGYWQEYTVKENTPEQIEFIKDYIANSAEGQRYAQVHREWIEGLEKEIDPLIRQGEDVIKREVNKHQERLMQEPGYYFQRGGRNPNFPSDKLMYSNENHTLASKAVSLLKNAKSILSSNRDGGGFWKGLKPNTQEVGEFLAMSEFLGDARLNSVIDKYQQHPESLTDEEKIIIQAKYISDQITAGVDPGSWYNIGNTTKHSLPFVRDFVMTAPVGGGVGSAVKSGASTLTGKTGLNLLLSRGIGGTISKLGKGAIDLTVRPAVQSMFSPSSYAMAYEEMQGQAIDRDENGNIKFDNRKSFGHGGFSAFKENHSEVFGEIVLDKLLQKLKVPIPKIFRTKAAQRIASTTGIGNPISEYGEEKESEFIDILRGEQTIEGFFDPRQNLETFGAVAIMQIPFTAINSTGYGIGKIQDVQAKRVMRKAYETSLSNLNNTLGQDAIQLLPTLNDIVENGSDVEIQSFLLEIIEGQDISEEQKRSIGEYVTAYSAYSGINKAKTEQVEEATQDIPAMIEENANPEMGAVVHASIAGIDTPVQIVGGNIVQNEDGTINREQSDQEIYYTDADGKRQVTSIKFIENLTENIPTQDAIAQVTEQVAAPIIAQQENEEIRPYQAGETVRFSPDGNTSLIGQIEGQDEATGNYLLSVETPNGIQQMQVQPRQIVNEDNLEGVENGSPVIYTNQNGEQVQDVVATTPDLYAQGLIGFENGDVVPIANVVGLAQETEQTSIGEELPPPPADMMIGENGDVPYNPNNTDTNTNEPRVFEIEEGLSAVENADGTYSLNKQFAKSELKKADSLVKRLNEDYSDNGLAFETVQLPRKDASNPFEKPLWGVVAKIQQEAPVQEQSETPYQNRENEHLWNVAENSDNPIDITSAYNEAMQYAGEERLEEWQKQLLGRKINRASFERFGDRNYINGTIARSWFNPKGEETTVDSIDVIAQELGVTEQDIIDFILDHPSNRIKRGNDLTRALNFRFKELAREITGREVGGIESNSGRLLLSTLEYATNNTPTDTEMSLAESNVVLDIPQAMQFFLNDYMRLDEIADFDQFRNAVEEADKQGYFLFPLEPRDKEIILNYINNAEQQVNTLRNSNEELLSESIVEDVEKPTVQEQIVQAESETNTNPTEAQKEAGNYKKGKVTIQGLNISIEQPRGSVRSGTDENGKKWSIEMQNTYGYIGKTKSKDGDHIDVFLGQNPENPVLFVVDQVNQDGSFDEHKVMLGFDSIEQAREAYLSNYEEGWQGLGNITQTDIDTFKKWAKSDTRKIKPFAEYKEIQEAVPAQKEMLSEVKKRKKDGKYVVELDRRMSKTPLVLMARRALQYNGKWRKASNSIEFDNEVDAKAFRENERSLGEGTHYQSSTNIFKPVNEQTFNSLVDRLRQTGLARDVVTDKAVFDAKLDEVINDNATAKQVLSEMDTIKQEAIANGTFMLAPNGKPTKLNENQWLQVRTKPFLDWFGDWINNPEAASKVVDENGEPMVVYHATQSDFDSFSKRSMGKAIDQGTLGSGFYFTSSSENASVYAQNLHTNTGKRGGESIMPVFLSIKNPYDAQLLFEVSGDNKKESQNFTDKKKRQGYDGSKFEHRYDFAWFVAYEPTQIKSAISNNGEFDSRSSDIRMQVLNTNFDDRINNPIGIEEMEELGFSDLFYTNTPDPKLLKKFNTWLKNNPNAVLRLYHGTSDSIPVEKEGLKKTTVARRRSYQSESGYVYLSPFKDTAKMFGEIGNPYGNTVYEVLMPVRLLKPDTDQLNNQRKEGKDIGNTLADSIVYGRSVRVKGDIPPYLIDNIPVREQQIAEKTNSIRNKDRKVIRIDEHGKNIVWESGDYFIAIDDIQDGRYATLWHRDTKNKDGKRVGFLDTWISSDKSPLKGLPQGKKLYVNNVEIDKSHRGKGLSKHLYQSVIDFSAPDVVGLYSYLPNRINKKQVPNIWRTLNGIEDGDYQYIKFMRTNVGDVYGFVTPDGTVYLDSTRMNANTPIHEFGHLWNSFTKENNAELYNRGAELVKESEYWQRVNDNPSYRDMSDEAKVDEALAMAIGDKGEAIVNRNIKQRFIDWVKDVWNSIRESFGFKTDIAIEDMTLSDFTRRAVRNLLEGKRLTDVMQPTVFSAQDISEMEQIKQSSIDNGSFMKAPNGEPTNLTERQWLQVRSTNFKNWFGDWQNDTENSSKIVDENGEPKVVFHGTTHQFYEFTRDRGNVENHFGIGYYFSDSLTDIENNYLATGADLTNRIDKLAEQLEDNEDLSPEEARERAEEELKGSEEIILDVYLNMRYPMDVRPDAMYYDALEVYDEENDEYTENEDSMPMELYNALNNIQYNFSEADAQSIWNDVSDAIGGSWDGVSAYDVDKALRSSESLMYITDDEGNLASHEFIRSLYEEMGYDGIIMDADLEFGNRRESGKSMDMDSDTSHYIMFDPSKIKSATENKGDFNSDMNDIRFQSVNDVADAADSTMTEDMRNELDKKIKNLWFRIREAYEDRHLAVQKFLDVLRENGTEVAEHDDFYKKATHINGAIDAQLEQYNNKYQKPLNKAISELEKAGFDYRDIENYAILKHGLERNAWMKQDAINKYKENHPEATPQQIGTFEINLPNDFSGITAVEEEVGKHADWFIHDFEEKAGKDLIDNLWKRVKDATSYSLNKQLEGQLIDKKTVDDLKNRYDYYVPLRGHDAEVAEDRWDYSPDMGTYFVAPLLKAKGRKTRSESPFAYIASMAQSAINSSNRNILNQTVLRLAKKDKTNLLGVDKAWYEKTGERDGKPVYEVRSPEYNEDPEIYRKNIEEFEERMAKLAEAGLAVQSGKKLDIGGLFIKRKQADQHEVHVFQNGTEYVVYINANPAVARAINGSNAKDLHKDLRFFARVSRQMAANFTTRNPIFVLSNFSRDYIFSSSILLVKENAKYALQFQRNMLPSADALQRYIRGKADLNKQQDRYLSEYILNGAKTGFSHILELQKVQKQIERDIKKGEGRNVFRYLLDGLEGMNEFAENLSRLSVYITSREQGRSITQSVSDAKEVTVNFNRSGAGGLGAAWFRSLYLFVNAGIQALSNFAKVAQKNKAKTAMLISSYAMSGFLMPMLTALIGGDDGMDDYMKLSDWERQNNLCIYTGNGFIKIPLPHELRVFHKMGDEIYQSMFGKKDVTQSLLDTFLGFSDLIPANPMGAVDGSWADIMPDATKPFFQLAANRNFTGSRITNEWADPNKPGYLRVRTNKKGEPFAPAFLVKLAETLDNVTGGDGVEKGFVSFNPDVVNHLMRGYFGGLYNMGMQGLDVTSKTYDFTKTGEFKLKVRETPLKTFYTSESDLQTSGSGLNTKYFKVVDDTQETMRKLKGYKDQVGEGKLSVDEFAKKIESLNVPKANELYGRIKQIKKYESALKELDGQDQKDLEKIISDLKKEVIEVNNKLSE